MKLQAIVFDFDGTLAELTIDFPMLKRKVAALAEAFTGERPEVPEKPALEWLDDLAAEVEEFEGRDLALEFHCRGRLVIQATELDAARLGRLFPFTLDLLADLRGRGLGVGVITRNSTAAVKTVFPAIERHCDVFLAREDVSGVKPNPVHLHTALTRLGAVPEHSLMVGDHTLDIDTGKAAGALTAGVSSGNLDLQTLQAAGADFVAENCLRLVELLTKQGYLAVPPDHGSPVRSG
ncbi:MAG: HAD family hydrolase [Proteobacteria bacterium]|nr:HAD family hydrolase [Pseudomonadota bacterium]